MVPDAPQYMAPREGPAHAGESGVTMWDKFKEVIMRDRVISCFGCNTTSNTTSNYVPPSNQKPVDRGYYARTFGGKRRR